MEATVQVQKAMLLDDRIGFFLSESSGALTAGMIYRGQIVAPSAFEAFDNTTPFVVAIPPWNGTFYSCAVALCMPGGQMYVIVILYSFRRDTNCVT